MLVPCTMQGFECHTNMIQILMSLQILVDSIWARRNIADHPGA